MEIPDLSAVYDLATNRELLRTVENFVVVMNDKPQSVVLRLQNGPDTSLDLKITSTQPWLIADKSNMELEPGATPDLHVTIFLGEPDVIALLQFSWQNIDGSYSNSILIERHFSESESRGKSEMQV
jgi:hypothetical protein